MMNTTAIPVDDLFPPKKVIVLLQNHHPQDMKLITFALRANRVDFLLLRTVDECLDYLVNLAAGKPEPHA